MAYRRRGARACRQPLIAPRPLALSALDALTVREHLPIFEANGFGLREDGEGGEWCLTAVPFSKDTTFGEQDVQELVRRGSRRVPCHQLRHARESVTHLVTTITAGRAAVALPKLSD